MCWFIGSPAKAGLHLMVVNASNREKIADWLDEHNMESSDETTRTAMIAVQGPAAIEPPIDDSRLTLLR